MAENNPKTFQNCGGSFSNYFPQQLAFKVVPINLEPYVRELSSPGLIACPKYQNVKVIPSIAEPIGLDTNVSHTYPILKPAQTVPYLIAAYPRILPIQNAFEAHMEYFPINCNIENAETILPEIAKPETPMKSPNKCDIPTSLSSLAEENVCKPVKIEPPTHTNNLYPSTTFFQEGSPISIVSVYEKIEDKQNNIQRQPKEVPDIKPNISKLNISSRLAKNRLTYARKIATEISETNNIHQKITRALFTGNLFKNHYEKSLPQNSCENTNWSNVLLKKKLQSPYSYDDYDEDKSIYVLPDKPYYDPNEDSQVSSLDFAGDSSQMSIDIEPEVNVEPSSLDMVIDFDDEMTNQNECTFGNVGSPQLPDISSDCYDIVRIDKYEKHNTNTADYSSNCDEHKCAPTIPPILEKLINEERLKSPAKISSENIGCENTKPGVPEEKDSMTHIICNLRGNLEKCTPPDALNNLGSHDKDEDSQSYCHGQTKHYDSICRTSLNYVSSSELHSERIQKEEKMNLQTQDGSFPLKKRALLKRKKSKGTFLILPKERLAAFLSRHRRSQEKSAHKHEQDVLKFSKKNQDVDPYLKAASIDLSKGERASQSDVPAVERILNGQSVPETLELPDETVDICHLRNHCTFENREGCDKNCYEIAENSSLSRSQCPMVVADINGRRITRSLTVGLRKRIRR